MAAAPAKGQGLAVAGCNYVGQDQIWKDHVHQEESAAKKWPENWSFMTQKYEEDEERYKLRYREMVKDEVPRMNRDRLPPPTPTRLPQMTPLQERVTVIPSPRPLPRTTSQMIGWRSSERGCQLEVYGRYAPPKGGLVKQLNWPTEAID